LPGVISLIVFLLIWRFLIVFGESVFASAGLSPNAAAFEARSAIVGAGYTTSQSEFVTQDPAARRVASLLVITGYFGPTVILTLLGVSFVLPTAEDLSPRAVVLVALLAGLIGLDRFGAIRAAARRPARVLARRMIARTTFESWIAVGDHAVAAIVLSPDTARAAATRAALDDPGVTVLAVERAGGGPTETTVRAADAEPGDRVVVFGRRQALAPLANVA